MTRSLQHYAMECLGLTAKPFALVDTRGARMLWQFVKSWWRSLVLIRAWCILHHVDWQHWRCHCMEGTARLSSLSGKRGGLVTEGAFKGDNPVAEEVRELCAYSIHGSLVTQEVGFWETVQWSADSSFWFSLSVSPLVCRWKPELRLTLAPRAGQKVLHTCEVNWGPWSEGLEGNSMESEYVVDQILGCFRSGR